MESQTYSVCMCVEIILTVVFTLRKISFHRYYLKANNVFFYIKQMNKNTYIVSEKKKITWTQGNHTE